MKLLVVLFSVYVAAALCLSGCGGASHGAGVIPGPHGGPPSSGGGPPPSGGGTASYQGCAIFTAGDWYNQAVTGASVDPNSANYIASAAAVDSGGFYLSTGVEQTNLANTSTSTYAVHATVPYHQNEWNANPPWPWQTGYFIEPLSDKHAMVMVVNPPSCRLFETFGTIWVPGVFSAYSGWSWDLSQPFKSLPAGWPSAMASGLSLFAGAVKAEEIEAGVINHALNWAGTAHAFAQWTFVSPASDTDGLGFSGGNVSYQLPYGAHLRLKASFNDSSFGPQAKAITTALKTYGMFLADTGSSNALYGIEAQDGLNHWNLGDLSALSSLHITDFEVLSLPSLQRVPGH